MTHQRSFSSLKRFSSAASSSAATMDMAGEKKG